MATALHAYEIASLLIYSCRFVLIRDWTDLALLFADSSRLSAKILWCLCGINRCHERNIQYPGAIVIGEDNNESTRWIEKYVIACWHIDYSAVPQSQSKQLARIDRFTQCISCHKKLYFTELTTVSISLGSTWHSDARQGERPNLP